MRRLVIRALFLVIPILLGLGVLIVRVQQRPEPERLAVGEEARVLRVIEAPKTYVVPKAIGYGRIKAAKVWSGIAQVSGEIIETHERLSIGSIIPQGEILARIDPTDYQLRHREIQTKIQATQAEILTLDLEEQNFKKSLEIEQQSLTLLEEDLNRKTSLHQRGTVAQAVVDQAQQNVLAYLQRVQNLTNSLTLIPSRRSILQARLTQQSVELERVKRDLERTSITAPFHLRLSELNVEEKQAILAGQTLFKGESIKTAEVEAQIPISQLRDLFLGQPPLTLEGFSQIDQIPLTATITYNTITWEAKVARFLFAVDPTARTSGVVVSVDDHYQSAIPGKRPPLLTNMYVKVELRAPPREDFIIVPPTAVFEGLVYIVDHNRRLQARTISGLLRQTDFMAIQTGIQEGEWVVISDPTPAIEGMLVEPILDPEQVQRLIASAQGLP